MKKHMSAAEVENFKNVIKGSQTINEAYYKLKIGIYRIKDLINQYKLDTSHFTPGIGKSTRGLTRVSYNKVCPVCLLNFITFRSKQVTCGYRCSNIHFRSGENGPTWKPYSERERKDSYYRKICFKYHTKKCICCNEQVSVDVHHVDGDCTNNKPENLVPICPNHHRYLSIKKQKKQIEKIVNEYIINWKRPIA